MNQTSTWGAHAPSGSGLFLRGIVRSGLSRGPVRKLVQRSWLKRVGAGPVDIDYHGLKLRLVPDRNVTDKKLLFRSGVRDIEEMDRLAPYAGPDSVFLDIGANVGYYSLFASKLGFQRIVSIEPNPVLLERIRFNLSANDLEGRMSVDAVAVSDRRCEMFLDAPDDMGSGRIHGEATGSRSVRVPVELLSDVLERQGVKRVTAFKIDVEGHEDKALLPYLRALSDEDLPKMGIIEHVHRSEWSEDLCDYMSSRGYRVDLQNRSNFILKRA